MNKTKKNIVLIGFNEIEAKSIDIPLIGKNYYLTNLEELKQHQGYLLIINNKDNINVIDFDKKYRKSITKYERIWLYNENNKNYYYKWSNIELINRDIFLIDSLSIWEHYEQYKSKQEQKTKKQYTNKRLTNINNLYNYLKVYKTIKTAKIAKDLNLNARQVQRYMQDINDIYHNIGYDYSNNEWYIIW